MHGNWEAMLDILAGEHSPKGGLKGLGILCRSICPEGGLKGLGITITAFGRLELEARARMV